MKNLKLFTLVAAASALLFACKPTAEEARKYNDDLIAIEKTLSEKENAFIATFADDKTVEEKNAAYSDLVKQANESVSSAEKMPVFDNNSSYLDAAKEYFATIKGLTNNEYKQLLDLASKKQEEVTEDDEVKYNSLIKTIQEKSDVILNKIQSEQLIFATKYNFKVEETTTETK